MSQTILSVVGARPNFIKLAALHQAFAARDDLRHLIVHTGQHYDFSMSEQFFQELALPTPDHHLGIGSGTQAEQVGRTMIALEAVFTRERPDWIVVVGDVNATAAAALAAKKLGQRLVHVEAGLRSFDWSMPEEINRVVTDRLADLLLVSDPKGLENLAAEGQDPRRIRFVGNVMIDTLLRARPLAETRAPWEPLGATRGDYAILTMHRPGNVDDPEKLRRWMEAIEAVAGTLPVLFPVHPRTKKNLEAIGYAPGTDRFVLTGQVGYLDMVGLQLGARLALTDSGGIQEETTALGIPCLTLRPNTERPVTIEAGTNRLVGDAPEALAEAVAAVLADPPPPRCPEGWDGGAGARVADALTALADLPPRQA